MRWRPPCTQPAASQALSTRLTARELEFVVRDSGIRALIYDRSTLDTVRAPGLADRAVLDQQMLVALTSVDDRRPVPLFRQLEQDRRVRCAADG